ncbi:hypothetical protein [Flavobacterium quisquiliarum]|uniref:Uncharacterized protein n=1 Tax=Flavobacterium quisquiliarum TaxID=1834436 RepID=A0ABV8WD96_9FLAO|nr:hypothetical protein [Flavobacterium quisquiliarum]MBW1657830.1 hypothetical protein [Flavobacterium quisquiliarum]NWL04170.1 hypothetical protein [Flavobacterium collinsii]
MIKKLALAFVGFTFMLILCSFEMIDLSEKKNQQENIEYKIVYDKKKHNITLSWPAFGSSGNYIITRGGSRLASEFIQVGTTSKLSFTDVKPNKNKYENYYKVTRNGMTVLISLENQIFGSNMYFYDRKYEKAETARNDINAQFETIGLGGANGEWTTKRQAYYFKPNVNGQTYDSGGSGSASSVESNSIELGFYSHIGGLGKVPSAVKLGSIFTRPHLSGGANATCTFWRSIENLTVMRDFAWTVSQSTSARRMLLESTSKYISDIGNTNFWGSGGFIADTHYASSRPNWGGQQQWYTRNAVFPSGSDVMGGSYNMVWQGCVNPPQADDVNSPISTTPIIREKPFLFLDDDGEYKIFVPAWQKDRVGVSWSSTDMGEGEIQDLLTNWYVTKAGDTDVEINVALKAGKNIFFTPGHYSLNAPIQVNRKDAMLLGAGIASVTLEPTEKNTWGCIYADDKDGIIIAGLLMDSFNSTTYQIRIGNEVVKADHSADPILLSDITCRVGGVQSKNIQIQVSMQINSNNVVGDHFWLWRADHGSQKGGDLRWTRDRCKNGLIVTGNDVTLYGLFTEHYQEYEVLWLGERGRTFFFQNEPPYDAPNQASWSSQDGRVEGYAAFKVANRVKEHHSIGMGSYAVFTGTDGKVNKKNGFEAPNSLNVKLEKMCITRFAGPGNIQNVVNSTGGSTATGAKRVTSYHNGEGVQPYDEEFTLPNNESYPAYIKMDK